MILFKTKRQRELEREIQYRQGRSKVQRFIRSAVKVQRTYWRLGKEALRLGDTEQFRRLAAAYLRTAEHVNRWQRYLLQLETLGVRREEVSATGEFIRSVSAMTASMLRGAGPEQVAKMQLRMEQALAKSAAVEEVLAVAMEASSDAVFGAEDPDGEQLGEITLAMTAEAEADEAGETDRRTAQSIRQVEEDMRKEMR